MNDKNKALDVYRGNFLSHSKVFFKDIHKECSFKPHMKAHISLAT